MKKLFFIALPMLLFCCKDVKDSINEIPDPFHGPDKIVDLDTLLDGNKPLKVDTLVFEQSRKLNQIDKVLAIRIKNVYSKDSIEKTVYRLDFYQKEKLIHSVPVQVYASSEDPMWSLYEGAFMDEKTKKNDSRFFEVSFGVPACGFSHSNFLFFMDKGKLQLVTQYHSMADGAYGVFLSFDPKYDGDKVTAFSSKNVEISNDESKPYIEGNEDNEDLVIMYSDSTDYRFDSGKWSGKLKSPNGKVYRTEFKKFNQLYKQE